MVVHFALSDAIQPLLVNLPQTLDTEEKFQQEDKIDADAAANLDAAAAVANPEGAANDYYDTTQRFGDDDEQNNDDAEEDEEHEDEHSDENTVVNERALEGSSAIRSTFTDWLKASTSEKISTAMESSGINQQLDKVASFMGIKNDGKPPSFMAKWLHPEEYEDFVAIRKQIPPECASDEVNEIPDDYKQCNYTPPDLWMPKPMIWIPQDDAYVSRQEVAQTKEFTPISDQGAVLDAKGRVIVHFEAAPFNDRRVRM